ncbi:L-sorbose 1-dehydrogenase [Lachnellula suecica]|uniref:L-sorbose 1-dehydrogenase n=1 Tax=Lachnellula suecica TaxID=602035 RepID=A0A8T9BVG8_9HELO|nr:L-sorbose 1-dehydrogenase [Lachnellula suecica]
MWWPFTPKYPERSPEEVNALEFDYVVVGGGTAGCVLASRLSEDPDVSVLVLERGVANDTWLSRVPMISFNIYDPQFGAVTWESEPMKRCENRKLPLFTGEVLGGNSRINGTVYTRGSTADYNAWVAMGRTEWSYDKVLPYFVKAQTSISRPKSAYSGDSGSSNPSRPPRPEAPWSQSIISWNMLIKSSVRKTVIDWGLSSIDDINAPDAPSDGFGLFDLTMSKNRKRVSTLEAFLPKTLALERRKNLTICTNAIVSRIEFPDGKTGHKAERVLFQYADRRSPQAFSAKAKKEVIVSTGAIGSPQILMLSGIGPREHLEECGIQTVRDLQGVGSNLSDHMAVPITWQVPAAESLTHLISSPLKAFLEFMKYVFLGTGILSLPVQMMSIFVRASSISDDELNFIGPASSDTKVASLAPTELLPDFEFMPLPIGGTDDYAEHKRRFFHMGLFTFLTTLLRPKSRGTVRLASSDPFDRPKVDCNFMSDPEDWPMIRKAIRVAMKLSSGLKSQGYPLMQSALTPESDSDDDINKMAPESDDVPGVVADDLRVHGFSNLRVCDASIFPQTVCTHTQAPVVMVAEKCADMIKASHSKNP